MDVEVQESVDFDFFETPQSPVEESLSPSPKARPGSAKVGTFTQSSPDNKTSDKKPRSRSNSPDQLEAPIPKARPRSAKVGGFIQNSPDDSSDKKPRSRSPDPEETPSPKARPRSAKVGGFTRSSPDNKSSDKRSRSRSRSPAVSSSPEYSSDSVSESEDSYRKDKVSAVNGKKKTNRSDSYSSDSKRGRNQSESSISSDSSSIRSWSGSSSDCRKKAPKSADSRSGSEKGQRSRSKNSKEEKRYLPKRGSSRQGDDEFSSSAYSEEEVYKKPDSPKGGSRKKKGSKDTRTREHKQAWGESSGKDTKSATKESQSTSGKARPKTAKQRTSAHRRDMSPGSDALSDSDMTDVSSMDSPRNQSRDRSKLKGGSCRIDDGGDGDSVKIQYRAMPITDADILQEKTDYEKATQLKSGLDLDILMEAVGELEKQKRLQANSRRVMFAPMTLKRSENYTFDKDKTRDIERENQRLLKEIVRRVNSSEPRKQFTRGPSTYKLTPSAVNREREMKRIEAENVAFLKRLQKVKATKTISRESQLKSYEGTKLHGVPISALHPMPRSSGRRSMMSDSASSIGSRTRSMTSIASVASSGRSTSSHRSSRPSSATKRIDTRPQWSDRW